MKIIYNKHFPFGPFFATNICGIIFCRSDKGRMNHVDKNHEYIHTLQQKEMLYIGFMLWYSIEWLYRLIKHRSFMMAYYNLYFEREAYANERNLNYAVQRKPFAWVRFAKEGSIINEISNFIGDIISFIRDDFRWSKYLFAVALAVSIIVGQVVFNIYDIILAPSYDNGTSMLCVPLFYIAVYFFVLLTTLAMHGELWRMRQWQAWAFPALLVAIDGAGQGFDAYKTWIMDTSMYFKDKFYLQLVGSFFFRSVAIISLLCIFRWATTGRFGLYGMTRSTKYLRVYGLIFLCLLPVFIIVSTTPQFLEFYPKMNLEYYSGALGWPDWKTVSVFEVCYANDFIGVESMFRGALVVGLSRWLGPRTVLPMALTYMCIHLGKPDLELCSSVVGGYFLGILAYKTQHLWGGIIIHLGIAMLFEFIAFLLI